MMSFRYPHVTLLEVAVDNCKRMIHLGSVAVGAVSRNIWVPGNRFFVCLFVYYGVSRKSFRKKRTFRRKC